MRKILTTICALGLAALIPGAIFVSRILPADARPYIESKYAGWSGVLQAWIFSDWSPGGSFITWLNSCAADFEKDHDGVFIEFTPVDESTLRCMTASGIPMPDLVFFSPGTLESSADLLPMEIPGELRREFRDFQTCLPVAMGGYIWVYNRTMDTDTRLILPDDAGRSFSAALFSLSSTI